jgi:hypothetical protein
MASITISNPLTDCPPLPVTFTATGTYTDDIKDKSIREATGGLAILCNLETINTSVVQPGAVTWDTDTLTWQAQFTNVPAATNLILYATITGSSGGFGSDEQFGLTVGDPPPPPPLSPPSPAPVQMGPPPPKPLSGKANRGKIPIKLKGTHESHVVAIQCVVINSKKDGSFVLDGSTVVPTTNALAWTATLQVDPKSLVDSTSIVVVASAINRRGCIIGHTRQRLS